MKEKKKMKDKQIEIEKLRNLNLIILGNEKIEKWKLKNKKNKKIKKQKLKKLKKWKN